MKKGIFFTLLSVLAVQVYAQEGLKAGVNLGLPVGDAGDVSGLSLGIDAMYHWEVTETFNAGIAAGFTNAFGKEIETGFGSIEIEDVQFLPIAASGRFMPADRFNIGVDLGYAIGISDGNDGGFYYRPIIGYGMTTGTELNLSYTGISLDGGTWSTINLGVLFNL